MYKIILADDHSATRKGVKACLEQDKLFRVVFEASNGYELENILDKRLYDIILLDINMKDMDGIEFLKRCRKKIINKIIRVFSKIGLTKNNLKSLIFFLPINIIFFF